MFGVNHENLTKIIEQYVSRFDELNARDGGDEGYKWRAETCFKRHWDIDAEDFPEMFRLAMSETSNLIDNKTVQPIGGISNLLKNPEEIEFVRTCFRHLFSEDEGNLTARQDRIETFMEKVNSRINKYNPGTWKYLQAFNNVLYYLNCAYHYGFYSGMYIPKLTTKERIKASKTQKEREALQQQIQFKAAELKTLEQAPIALPSSRLSSGRSRAASPSTVGES